jgi:hypothetical protein
MEKVFSRGQVQFQGKHNFSLLFKLIFYTAGETDLFFSFNIFVEVGHFTWSEHYMPVFLNEF